MAGVTLPHATPTTPSFYLKIPSAGVAGYMVLLINGQQSFLATEVDATQYADWTRVQVDLSPLADGGPHIVEFYSYMDASASGADLSFFLDSVCIQSTMSAATVPNVLGQTQSAASGSTARQFRCVPESGPGTYLEKGGSLTDFML